MKTGCSFLELQKVTTMELGLSKIDMNIYVLLNNTELSYTENSSWVRRKILK